MTTTRRPGSLSLDLLLVWHGLFAGAYMVAFLTAEGVGSLHRFAGYAAMALLALRLLAAFLAPDRSPWALPMPSSVQWKPFLAKLGKGDWSVFRNRTPLATLSGLVLLGMLVIVIPTGMVADFWDWDDPHEAIAEGSLAVVLVHVALVSLGPALKRLAKRGKRQEDSGSPDIQGVGSLM
jgi:cytochrome b